jgi:hypothetical protein
LEPAQAGLLERICAGRLRTAEELREADAFATEEAKAVAPKRKSKSKV